VVGVGFIYQCYNPLPVNGALDVKHILNKKTVVAINDQNVK